MPAYLSLWRSGGSALLCRLVPVKDVLKVSQVVAFWRFDIGTDRARTDVIGRQQPGESLCGEHGVKSLSATTVDIVERIVWSWVDVARLFTKALRLA
jgi:hypothetical protein